MTRLPKTVRSPQPKRGGARPGAGRKTTIDAVKLSLSLPRATLKKLDAMAHEQSRSRSRLIAEAVRRLVE